MIAQSVELPPKASFDVSAEGQLLSLFVYALEPINVFIVDSANRDLYSQGMRFEHHGPGPVQFFSSIVQQANAGPWTVIFENPSDHTVRIDFNVS